MKNFIQKVTQKFNTIIQDPELTATIFDKVSRAFCKDLLFLKKELGFNFDTIIDVGAAVGDYSKAANIIYPNAKIYAFEPIPDSFDKLKSKASKIKNIQCFNLALSDKEGEVEFHLNEFSFSSSFLKMSEMHKEIYPFTKNETIIKVKSNKLENILKNFSGNAFLKLDVQGSELRVLKGATNVLGNIQVIQLEVSFLNFYEGQASIEDIISFLKQFGFNSFLQVSPVFDKNKLLSSDFIFLKNSDNKSN